MVRGLRGDPEDACGCRRPSANRAVYNLRLAEQSGAETVTLRGNRIAAEIIDFARQRQIGTIVAGAPARHDGPICCSGAPVDDLVRLSGRRHQSAGHRRCPGEQRQGPCVAGPETHPPA
jgi:K+-sensing histidine kinase KdpD